MSELKDYVHEHLARLEFNAVGQPVLTVIAADDMVLLDPDDERRNRFVTLRTTVTLTDDLPTKD